MRFTLACILFASTAALAQLALPYSGTITSTATAFTVTNNWATAPNGGHAIDAIADFINSTGIYARSNDGKAIWGSSTTGIPVLGVCGGAGCTAGYFYTAGMPTNTIGVIASSTNGTGLLAQSVNGRAADLSTSGTGTTVFARSLSGTTLDAASTNGAIVLNASTNSSLNAAIVVSNPAGAAISVTSSSVYNPGIIAQTYGNQAAIVGIQAASSGGANGVSGQSTSLNGVQGRSYSGSASGVYGENSAVGGGGYGVAGRASGSGIAVFGDKSTPSTGYAGYFSGNVQVTGNFAVSGSKAFMIDHPLDPGNKFLVHSSVESNEMKNLYDGVTVLDAAGHARIQLPTWFEAVNGDFRYQLTAIGKPGNLYIASELAAGSFEIAGSPGQKVSWQVTGNRRDPAALASGFAVERDKLPSERGTYLRPELISPTAQGLVRSPFAAPAYLPAPEPMLRDVKGPTFRPNPDQTE